MPYRYHCRECAIPGAVHPTKHGAHKDQSAHRATAHGGMTPPAGDHVRYARPDSRGVLTALGIVLILVAIKNVFGVAPADVAHWLGLI
jgi:hypothetical protein